MKPAHFTARVARTRRGWRVSVPELPRDAPAVTVKKLDNAPALLIDAIAEYLGAAPSTISVDVPLPRRRKRLTRPSATAVQLLGAAGALTGVYLTTGTAVTLLVTGVIATALGTLREAGKI